MLVVLGVLAVLAGCGGDASSSDGESADDAASAAEAPVSVSGTAQNLPAAASDYCNGAGVSKSEISRQINSVQIEWEQLSKQAEQDGQSTDKLNKEYQDIAERTALSLDLCDLDLSQEALEVVDQIITEG